MPTCFQSARKDGLSEQISQRIHETGEESWIRFASIRNLTPSVLQILHQDVHVIHVQPSHIIDLKSSERRNVSKKASSFPRRKIHGSFPVKEETLERKNPCDASFAVTKTTL